MLQANEAEYHHFEPIKVTCKNYLHLIPYGLNGANLAFWHLFSHSKHLATSISYMRQLAYRLQQIGQHESNRL